jgi:hypothetical protein
VHKAAGCGMRTLPAKLPLLPDTSHAAKRLAALAVLPAPSGAKRTEAGERREALLCCSDCLHQLVDVKGPL